MVTPEGSEDATAILQRTEAEKPELLMRKSSLGAWRSRTIGINVPWRFESRLILEDGNIMGVQAFARAITERKQSEEEKAFLQEQLRQSQKMEAIGRWQAALLTISITSSRLSEAIAPSPSWNSRMRIP